MSKRNLIRAVAVLLLLCMTLTTSGCTSLFTDIEISSKSREDGDSEYNWSNQTTTIERTVNYPSNGKNAFYIDDTKCLKDEIEEFHLLTVTSAYTVYYYTAAANPSFEDATGTGYYCLAAYDFNEELYYILVHGFYDKKNGNASIAYAIDEKQGMGGICFACIGDTYLMINLGDASAAAEEVGILESFYLSDDNKASIEDEVGGKYTCIDIALIDTYTNRIAAAYMNVDELEDNESEDPPSIVVFDIEFDDDDEEDEPVHDIDVMRDGLIMGTENVISSTVDYASDFTGAVFTYDYDEDSTNVLMRRNSQLLSFNRRQNFKYKKFLKNDKTLEAFSLQHFEEVDGDNTPYIFYLRSDGVLSEIKVDIYGALSIHSYQHQGDFKLPESLTLSSFDNYRSILFTSPDMLYACTLDGVYKASLGGETSLVTGGSYYAIYNVEGENFILLGFDNTEREVVEKTYRNGELVKTTTQKEKYTMNDMPFAKISEYTFD